MNNETSNTSLLTSLLGSDLRLRLISMLLLGPVILVIVWFGGVPYLITVGICATLMTQEWFTIILPNQNFKRIVLVLLSVFMGSILIGIQEYLYALICFVVSIIYVIVLPQFSKQKAWLISGILYVAFSTTALIFLRIGENGLQLIFGLFALVWAFDSGSYLCGRLIGGPKLWEAVSPKKTWSGMLGGLIIGIAVISLMANLAGYDRIGMIVLLAFLVSVVAQFGDLAESSFKRKFNTKDSGSIIPGHGGILDRVDGLVVAAMFVFIVGLFLSSGTDPTHFLNSLQVSQ